MYHLINEELLKQCHKELDGNKAEGIDKVLWYKEIIEKRAEGNTFLVVYKESLVSK